MNNLKNSILSFGSLFIVSLLVNVSRAQGTCYINGEAVPCDQMPAWLGPVMIVFFILMFVIAIVFTIFWLKMFIHAAKHDVPNKVMWLIGMLVFGQLAALIYYFAVKKTYVAPMPMQAASATAPAPQPMQPPTATPTV